MLIPARLERKVIDFDTRDCHVEKLLVLPEDEFKEYLQHPYLSKNFITENRELMYGVRDAPHCILVMGQYSDEGILVDAEGYDYARYAGHLPGARDIVNSHVDRAADFIIRAAQTFGEDGVFRYEFGDLAQTCNLIVAPGNGFDALILEELSQRDEVAEVNMEHRAFVAELWPQFRVDPALRENGESVSADEPEFHTY